MLIETPWLWIIRVTSPGLLKAKRTMWTSRFWILKPLVDLQNCLNVRPTASIFKTRLVKNFATIMNSDDLWLLWSVKSEPSLLFSERLLQVLVRSSIVETVFPKDPQAQEVNLLPFEDRHTFTRKGQIILRPKRRWQSQNFLSDKENQIFIRLFNNHRRKFFVFYFSIDFINIKFCFRVWTYFYI